MINVHFFYFYLLADTQISFPMSKIYHTKPRQDYGLVPVLSTKCFHSLLCIMQMAICSSYDTNLSINLRSQQRINDIQMNHSSMIIRHSSPKAPMIGKQNLVFANNSIHIICGLSCQRKKESFNLLGYHVKLINWPALNVIQ